MSALDGWIDVCRTGRWCGSRKREVDIDEALLDQLAPGGRIVIPLGDHSRQELVRIERGESGDVRESLAQVAFVPLLPGQG